MFSIHIATAASLPQPAQVVIFLLLFSYFFFSNYTTFSLSLSLFIFSLKEMETREREIEARRVRFFLFFFGCPNPPPFSFSSFLLLLTEMAQPRKMCIQLGPEKKKSPPLAPFKGSLEIGFLWPFFSFSFFHQEELLGWPTELVSREREREAAGGGTATRV